MSFRLTDTQMMEHKQKKKIGKTQKGFQATG